MISSEEMQHSCHMDWLKNELYMMYRHENNNVLLNYTIHISPPTLLQQMDHLPSPNGHSGLTNPDNFADSADALFLMIMMILLMFYS